MTCTSSQSLYECIHWNISNIFQTFCRLSLSVWKKGPRFWSGLYTLRLEIKTSCLISPWVSRNSCTCWVPGSCSHTHKCSLYILLSMGLLSERIIPHLWHHDITSHPIQRVQDFFPTQGDMTEHAKYCMSCRMNDVHLYQKSQGIYGERVSKGRPHSQKISELNDNCLKLWGRFDKGCPYWDCIQHMM